MKIVCIVSGGMDSVTLVKSLYNTGHYLECLSFDYGQRHKKELIFAKKLCKGLGINHHIVDLTSAHKLLGGSSLTTKTIKTPHGHYQAENMKLTVVPNRNMIMLSIAAGYAISLKFDAISYAAHSGDHDIYPDCREEFVNALEKAINIGNYHQIQIFRPFLDLTKGEIAKIGIDLGIDYDKETWTCYEGGRKPCGECGACNERKGALEYARRKHVRIES